MALILPGEEYRVTHTVKLVKLSRYFERMQNVEVRTAKCSACKLEGCISRMCIVNKCVSFSKRELEDPETFKAPAEPETNVESQKSQRVFELYVPLPPKKMSVILSPRKH